MKKIKNLNNIKDINSVIKSILGKGFFAKEIVLDFELDESKKENRKTKTTTNAKTKTQQKPKKEKLIKIKDEMSMVDNDVLSLIDIRLIEEVKSHMTISLLDNDFTSLEKPVRDDGVDTEKNSRILSDLSCFDLDNV